MSHKRTAMLILSVTLAQGLVYPSIAMGLEQPAPTPSFTSSEEVLDATKSEINTDDESAKSESGQTMNADQSSGEQSVSVTTEPSQPSTVGSEQEDASQAPQSEDAHAEASRNADGDVSDPMKDYTGWDENRTHWYINGEMAKAREVYDPQTKGWYYFKLDGEMLRNSYLELNGRTLRYGNDGRMVKGEATVDGVYHFFEYDDGRMSRDKDVYLREQDRWIRFDKNGNQIKNREHFFNGGWYYFDANGTMAKGMTHVSSNGGKWVYYDIYTGRMQYGQRYLNYDRNHTGWYLFDTNTGATKYGFQNIPEQHKRVFYHRATGQMLYGENCIDGSWYYMDKHTGAMAKGFVNLPGKRVYYNPSTYRMVYGPALVNNRPYYFNSGDGRMWNRQDVINKLVSTARGMVGKRINTVAALQMNGGLLCPYGPCMTTIWYLFYHAGLNIFLCNGAAKNGRQSGWPQDNYDWYSRQGRIRSNNPKVGDLVFFYWKMPGNGWATNAHHAGFVMSVNGRHVTWLDDVGGIIKIRDGNAPEYSRSRVITYATPYYG